MVCDDRKMRVSKKNDPCLSPCPDFPLFCLALHHALSSNFSPFLPALEGRGRTTLRTEHGSSSWVDGAKGTLLHCWGESHRPLSGGLRALAYPGRPVKYSWLNLIISTSLHLSELTDSLGFGETVKAAGPVMIFLGWECSASLSYWGYLRLYDPSKNAPFPSSISYCPSSCSFLPHQPAFLVLSFLYKYLLFYYVFGLLGLCNDYEFIPFKIKVCWIFRSLKLSLEAMLLTRYRPERQWAWQHLGHIT